MVCKDWTYTLNFLPNKKPEFFFELFKDWAKHGKLEQMKCIQMSMPINNILKLFNESCSCGHLHVAKWLHFTFKLSELCVASIMPCFINACLYGHKIIAQWLTITFELKSQDVRTEYKNTFLLCCCYEELDVVEWLFKTFDFCEDKEIDQFILEIYEECCMEGRLNMIKWAHSTFKLNEDINARLLRLSCNSGSFQVAQWLYDTFKYNIEDIRKKFDIFAMTCINGFWQIAEWLHSIHKYDKMLIVSSNLIRNIQYNRVKTIAWLEKTF